ncbi:MAG TPA: hypothetical protein VD884_09360 [Ohtaekwangia sp.]|nr:hypothetical protein [Ohtaekwangia sp.]
MDTYMVHFEESEMEAVMDILSQSNDIVINNIEPTGIGITIQSDNAEDAYQALLQRIDRQVRTPHVIDEHPRTPE